jgi:hypothetical protein
LASPLIHVENPTQSKFDEINSIPLTSQKSLTNDHANKSTEHQSQQSQIMSPLHSVAALSPIEEESEEMETTNGIAFSLTNQDSSTKRHFIETDDKISDILTIDDNAKPSEKLSTPQGTTITTSHTFHPVNTTQKQKIDENKHVILRLIIKTNCFALI